MNLTEILRDGILILDGAMGTMLQNAGLEPGAIPEEMNLTHPDVLTGIHKAYVEAGSDVVTANTFQAGELKLARSKHCVEEIVAAGIRNARASGAKYVALDLGPVGQVLKPAGTVSFDQAYGIYKRQVLAAVEAGADLVIAETLSDLYEAKAAVLAVKENSSLPVFCSLTYQEDGRTFMGVDPVTAAVTLSGLGVDAVGVNCSLGPVELMPVVEKLLRYSRAPVFVQPNAGLPAVVDGVPTYKITPEEYAKAVADMVKAGVRIVGGCCGTTPAFIRAVKNALSPFLIRNSEFIIRPSSYTAATSGRRTTLFEGVTLIGERINPAGKKALQEAIREGDIDYILDEAIDQADAGCGVLDVNVSLADIDEPSFLASVVEELQGVTGVPLSIDSADPMAIERAARVYNGKPVINSVNGREQSLSAVLPIARKYGALVVALTLDEDGIPPTAEGRLAIAKRIVERAEKEGIPKEDILVDCLALTVAAQQEQAMETIKAIRMVKEELGVKTVLGVSNLSFGLPAREKLNGVFLAAALSAGLDAPILNPLSESCRDAVDCFRVLSGEDEGARKFIDSRRGKAD